MEEVYESQRMLNDLKSSVMIEISQKYEQKITGETKIKSIITNSLEYIALLVWLEDMYEIEFEEQELVDSLFETIEDLLNCIENKMFNI